MARNQLAEHVIDIDNLRTSMQREIYGEEPKSSLIHKIHWRICDKNKKDYEPSHLSIGPYHRGALALSAMEKLKWGYLNYFLELNHEKNLQDYLEAVIGLEEQARHCYSHAINMDHRSFVEMLLLDACFILMTLNGIDGIAPDLKTSIEETKNAVDERNDQFVIDVDETNDWHGNGNEDNSHDRILTKILLRDMLLLENQIPFFIITKIYEIVTRGRSPSLLVENLMYCIKDMFGCHEEAILNYDPSKEIHHLLHLCHMCFKPSQRGEENCQNYLMRPTSFHIFLPLSKNIFKRNQQNTSHYNADERLMARELPNHWRGGTQYHEARIELKKRKLYKDNPHSLLDIRFSNDQLEIPCLNIDAEIFTLFNNLIAFEQICPQIGNYMTSYVVFWSQFTATADDVALLSEKGIIRHGLHRDNEVADLFKSLTDFVVFDLNTDNYLNSVLLMVEAHYQIRRPRWKEIIRSIKSKVPKWALE